MVGHPLREAAARHRRAHREHADQEERHRVREAGEPLADTVDRVRGHEGHDGHDRGHPGRKCLEAPQADREHDHREDALALGAQAGGGRRGQHGHASDERDQPADAGQRAAHRPMILDRPIPGMEKPARSRETRTMVTPERRARDGRPGPA